MASGPIAKGTVTFASGLPKGVTLELFANGKELGALSEPADSNDLPACGLSGDNRTLAAELYAICNAALRSRGLPLFPEMPAHRVTVQGGIGTADEQALLRRAYQADATGWGTPFLLVPEAVNMDPDHLRQLASATEAHVRLSDHSPLGIPFWILTDSTSEQARLSEELNYFRARSSARAPLRMLRIA